MSSCRRSNRADRTQAGLDPVADDMRPRRLDDLARVSASSAAQCPFPAEGQIHLADGQQQSDSSSAQGDCRSPALGWQVPVVPQDRRVVHEVEGATGDAESLLRGDMDLPRDVIVASGRLSSDPVLADVRPVDADHDFRVLPPFADLGSEFASDRQRRLGVE